MPKPLLQYSLATFMHIIFRFDQFSLWRKCAEGLEALLRQGRHPWVGLLTGVAKPECTLYSHTDYVTCLAAAKDAPIVASAGLRGQVLLWDLPTTVRSAKQVRPAALLWQALPGWQYSWGDSVLGRCLFKRQQL